MQDACYSETGSTEYLDQLTPANPAHSGTSSNVPHMLFSSTLCSTDKCENSPDMYILSI